MSSTSEVRPQSTSINIKIPTQEYLAEKYMLIPICFSLIIILFFFTFCDFKVVGSMGESGYPANEQTQKSIKGLKFITGTSLPMSRINNEFAADALGLRNEQAQNLEKISFNIWAFIALAAAIGGVYVFWKKESKQNLYSLLLAGTGVVALLLLMSSVGKYEGKIDMGFISLQTKMVFRFPYWLALLSFLTAGVISYFRLKLSSIVDTTATSHPPTPIHVNIITQNSDTPVS